MSQSQDKLFEEIVQQSNQFDGYEKAFQEVLMELEGDELMEPFRKEYETLHHSFLKAHESEKRLIKKSQDLQAEIIGCQTKVRTAEELTTGDQQTIESLRKEIGKAKNKLEASRQKEVTVKEQIKQLRVDIRDLENQIKKGVSSLVGHDTTISELAKVKDDLTKERDTQLTQLAAIRGDIQEYKNKIDKLSAEKDTQDAELQNLSTVISMKQCDIEEQRKRKEMWEKDLKVMKADLSAKAFEIQDKQGIISTSMQTIVRLDEQLIDQKTQTEKAIKEYEQINKKTQKLQHDLDEEINQNSQRVADNNNLKALDKAKEAEIAQVKKENETQTALKNAIIQRNKTLEQSRLEVEEDRNALKTEILKMEMEIAHVQQAAENDRKQIDDLTRERDILNKNYLKAQASTSRQADWVLIKENQKRNLEQEIHGFERHAQKQRELIYQLQKEAEAYEKNAEEAAQKYQKALEAVKTQSQVVNENNRAISDSQNKLKQQQNLFETVLNERNLYSKQVLELHSEINEMRRKFRIMNHNISQLKDEIQAKEKALVAEHHEHERARKEKEEYRGRIKKHKTMIENNDRKITQLSQEINKLNHIINEAEAEKLKQKRDYDNVMNERDILGAQLIKRNDELAKLYENIRIQQSSLNKGELQYRDRLVDKGNLTTKIRQLSIELQNIKQYIARVDVLKVEVTAQTKSLTKERLKVRALADDLENPLNIHRWHKLEGSEPQTYETIQRIHKLQKQLITKTEEVSSKTEIIAEKEKLYLELKAILARQPGPEVAEQLNVYRDNLQKKTMQLKSMQASLAHFSAQAEQYKAEHEKLQADMQALKQTYFKQKRREARYGSEKAAQEAEAARAAGFGDGLTDEQRALLEESKAVQEQLDRQAAERQQAEADKVQLAAETEAAEAEGLAFEKMQADFEQHLQDVQAHPLLATDAAAQDPTAAPAQPPVDTTDDGDGEEDDENAEDGSDA
eukprot:NODE_47_length_3081_cov_91.739675_g45_i0.p1 GENE.NODE_47_length_3081_cov_91.739675_g45_i0~~NODE_47_length_3081_cov_91.739675_g45_i0.p1  ORF type:complete len:969 (+),score=396.45 NODE_47_length_3081_cov_91.739675_g45_i0:106-3012(+)